MTTDYQEEERQVMANLDYDRSVVGGEVEVGYHEVTKEKIIEYADALGETNPLYLDEEFAKGTPYGGIIAPPLFYNMFSLASGLDPKVNFGTTGFDAGQHAEFFEPVRPGDTIYATSQISSVYAKTGRTGTMVFTVRRTNYRNQNGELTTVVERRNVRRDIRK